MLAEINYTPKFFAHERLVKILKIEAVMALINLTDKINNSPKKTIVKHCHTLNATNSSRPFHKK